MTAHRFKRLCSIALPVLIAIGGAGLGGYNLASAEVSAGVRPVFIPVKPCRLFDTRVAFNVGPRATPLTRAETITQVAHGQQGRCTGASSIPSDAVGLSMNVTAVGATTLTFLTIWAGGSRPDASNLNPAPGQPPTPNAVNTPLSATGSFNLYNHLGQVDVLVDVNGYYVPHDHDDRYALLEALDDYPTTAELSDILGNYQTRDALGGLDFLARGTVNSAGTTASGFTAPAGVTATVTRSAVGKYVVTLTGLSGRITPTVQLNAIGQPNGSPRDCVIRGQSTGSLTYSVDVDCFRQNPDPMALESIEPADAGFHFHILD